MGDHLSDDRFDQDVRGMTRRGAMARALLAVLALVAGCMAVIISVSAPAGATDTGSPCPPDEPNCVGVEVGNPGDPGSGGTGTGTGTGGGAPPKPDPCAKYPEPLHTACAGDSGQQCLDLYDTYSATLSFDDLNQILQKNSCPTLAQAQAPPPSPATLAQQAAASFELPVPSGARSPSQNIDFHGYSHTYVGLWTWFWTSSAAWANCGGTCTATARAGGNYATVTAKPVSLTLDPGDGAPAVSCAGPGVPWRSSYGNDVPSSDGGCGYQYRTVTGPGYDQPVTAMQTITYQLTWTGSGNTSGTLTSRTTTTAGKLNVLQIQTVVVTR